MGIASGCTPCSATDSNYSVRENTVELKSRYTRKLSRTKYTEFPALITYYHKSAAELMRRVGRTSDIPSEVKRRVVNRILEHYTDEECVGLLLEISTITELVVHVCKYMYSISLENISVDEKLLKYFKLFEVMLQNLINGTNIGRCGNLNLLLENASSMLNSEYFLEIFKNIGYRQHFQQCVRRAESMDRELLSKKDTLSPEEKEELGKDIVHEIIQALDVHRALEVVSDDDKVGFIQVIIGFSAMGPIWKAKIDSITSKPIDPRTMLQELLVIDISYKCNISDKK